MKFQKKVLTLLAIVCLILTACLNTANGGKKLTGLTIATADSGGTMYPVGQAIADVITESSEGSVMVNVNASTGSVMNVQDLAAGKVDIGLVTGDIAYEAVQGLGQFEEPVEGLRVLGAVYSSTANWMAPVADGIFYVHELNGKTVVLGPEDSNSDQIGRMTLSALGVDMDSVEIINTSLSAGAAIVAVGSAVAIQGFAGFPIDGLNELSQKRLCRLLRFTKKELEKILAANPSYYREVIPAGTYTGQLGSVATLGVKCLLCVDESMSEETAYKLTELLWNSREQLASAHSSMNRMLDRDFVYEDLPIELHAGAEAFYREQGLLH